MNNWTRNWCSSLTNSHHTLLEYLGSSKCLPRPSTSNRPKSWPLLICNKSYRAVESSETVPAESAEWSDPAPVPNPLPWPSATSLLPAPRHRILPQNLWPGGVRWRQVASGGVAGVTGLFTQLSWHLVGQRKPWCRGVQDQGPTQVRPSWRAQNAGQVRNRAFETGQP